MDEVVGKKFRFLENRFGKESIMKSKWMMGVAALALVGCSSSPKTVPVSERISDTEGAMAKTDKLLTETQKELSSFAKRVEEFKKDSDRRNTLMNKARYETSLDRLLLAVQQSQVDLRELQSRNDERRRSFETRVNRAIEPGVGSESEESYQAD
jgi:septal ring factor EnvC (AmiA/AmiB activator)